MTAAASQSPEPYEVPEGGLASFLTATVGDWSDEALNADNYYDIVKPTAEQLAQFGREEDDRIAHVATGETIIPMAVFEEDPALKEALFTRMREMGIDPERYIVGNELNSINPVTGQPEFFLKKIFKGIKKAVKGVVKVFKKVAPIILSTVGFMVAGPLGASLGSGIGTLIQGGSFKDAFKSALIAGVTSGIGQGIGAGFKEAGQLGQTATFADKLAAGAQGFGESLTSIPQQFTEGIASLTGQAAQQTATQAATKPALTAADAVQQGAAPAKGISPTNELIRQKVNQQNALRAAVLKKGPTATQLAGMEAPTLSPPAGNYITGPVAQKATETATTGNYLLGPDAVQTTTDAATTGNYITGPATDAATTTVSDIPDLQGTGSSDPGGINFGEVASSGIQQNADRTFMQKVSDYMFRAGKTPVEVDAAISAARSDTVAQMLRDYGFESLELAGDAAPAIIKAAEAAAAKAGPGLMAKFGPSALALTGIGAAAGFFDPPEMEPLPDAFGGMTGQKLIDMYPSQYTLSAPGAYIAPSMAAADGGGIDTSKFPRRNGRISGPGTETSDDIPAMLSDGEFVMTAKAVRGAGNGSREAGMRNMYNMMSRFERNA